MLAKLFAGLIWIAVVGAFITFGYSLYRIASDCPSLSYCIGQEIGEIRKGLNSVK
jgi:hypothetical protein